mgnify:CR=1 FL=1
MTMTKQKAFHEWLANCPVDFDFQMHFESKRTNCTDEMYIFRGIPTTELIKKKS